MTESKWYVAPRNKTESVAVVAAAARRYVLGWIESLESFSRRMEAARKKRRTITSPADAMQITTTLPGIGVSYRNVSNQSPTL